MATAQTDAACSKHMSTRKRIRNVHVTVAAAAMLFTGARGYADILATSASVKPENSLIVDIQVTAPGSAAKLQVTYQTNGVDPLVSRWTPVAATDPTTITIGRLRANRTYTYTVRAIDKYGAPAGTAGGSFTTGSLPAAFLTNTYTLSGRTTAPLVIMPMLETGFNGYAAFDLHSADAPQIVWYYSNAPSTASGAVQIDQVATIVRERDGNFLFADGGTGSPPALAADSFYRDITPEGTILVESPATCSVTPPPASPAPAGWIWGQGNDVHEVLVPGSDGVPGTALHLAKIVRDPFFDAGLTPQGARLQSGIGIRRWNLLTGKDEIVWDPFNFLNPLTERTDAATSDPAINSDQRSAFNCAGTSQQIEEWMHANSLQIAPTGVVIMSVRHLDTVIAISPQFDRIAWRVGRFGSDFAFPNPKDRFYHSHYVRVLENGNLLLFDNGDGRPAAEGGQYSRALELALDWDSMTATRVWEYRHQLSDGSYKYADKVGTAERLENGNTLVLYGTDINPTTLKVNSPAIATLVEADANPEAGAVAVLDMLVPNPVYRALPVNTLFGEVPGK
jgi:hypothetical protein